MTKDTRRRFTFRLPEDLLEAVKQEACKQGTSLNAFILQILWEWVEKNKKKEKEQEK